MDSVGSVAIPMLDSTSFPDTKTSRSLFAALEGRRAIGLSVSRLFRHCFTH